PHVPWIVMTSSEPVEIGRRARTIRRRRGLSLDVAAGLAGISKSYLSLLETGQRRFQRRGLLGDLAGALGCSVADLTGQPYLPTHRASADALAAVPGIRLALADYGPDDVPDVAPRPLAELIAWADRANEHCDQTRFSLAGHDVGALLTESQVHAATATGADRPRAFGALVTACMVAGAIAKNLGNIDLSVTAARRGYDFARRAEDPGLIGFARWYWALGLMRLAARRRAEGVLRIGIDELIPAVQAKAGASLPARMVGMMHLTCAQTAAREGRGDDAHAHLGEAADLAARVGECNGFRQHFGPTNVAVWRLGIGVELGEGGGAYQDALRAPIDVDVLGGAERSSSLYLDLARALVQDGGTRDGEAIRHLDTADRIAPQRTRPDPIARDLVLTLDQRAHRRVWELDSLRNRFGLGRS
ncbi:MAG: helix-turn-helix transcriptional regulator, partial [Actinobacteria bacterium]|nr:helix-turn-helix transcriptional regulator [Actinomycetota bacterium]